MARSASEPRMEVWVDEEDFIPQKSNRQVRRAKRHKNKEKFNRMFKNASQSDLKNLDFDDFSDDFFD